MVKVAVITGFLGELRDRFCLYNRPHSILEKLEYAAKIDGVTGVEIIYQYDFQEPETVLGALKRLNLGVSAVNVNVKGEPEFAAGSLTSPDPRVRRKAVDFIIRGMEMAERVGAGRVTVCPLSDGHDYPFQADYEQDWRLLKESIGEAAASRPGVTLSLEYKPSETRVRSTLWGAYGTLLLIRDLGMPNLGVTVDVGHSLYALENPAQVLSLLNQYGVRSYIHVNDNTRNWDWDLMPGTINLWDLIEFFWTANRFGYSDWVTLDVFPARLDPSAAFSASARMVQAMARAARRIDLAEIRRLREAEPGHAVPAITEYVWKKTGIRLDEEDE